MKKLMIVFGLFAGIQSGIAQTTLTSETKSVASSSDFANVTMNTTGKVVNFTGLPQVQRPIHAIVKNSGGDEMQSVKINPGESSVDLQKLPKGMYFIFLVYKNVNKKTFIVNI
jgi:hypothetical protein